MVLTESMATTWQHKSGVECHYFTIYVVLSWVFFALVSFP
jgi:hypothetical protein